MPLETDMDSCDMLTLSQVKKKNEKIIIIFATLIKNYFKKMKKKPNIIKK